MSGSQFERSVQAAYRQNYQQVQLKYWALCGDLNRRKLAKLAADGSRHGLLRGVLQPAATAATDRQRQHGRCTRDSGGLTLLDFTSQQSADISIVHGGRFVSACCRLRLAP